MTIDEFLGKLEGVKPAGEKRWTALCPAHEDRRASLSVGRGENGLLLKCHAGCETSAVLAKLGLKPADLFDKADRGTRAAWRAPATGQIVYPYRDEQGRLLFEVVRGPDKTFHQRRPDPLKPGRWIPKLDGVRRVPYRLPELLAAATDEPVFVTEGEKDADNVREHLGLVATTNPGGTGSGRLWADQRFAAPLAGRSVIVLPDNDPPGHQHAARVAESLVAAGAKNVRVLELPGLSPKGDMSDWIAAGGNRAQILELAGRCPVFQPRQTDVPAGDAESDQKPEKVSEAQRILELAQPAGPFPVLVLQGEQGSAKSTTARVLRALIDPSQSDLRVMPKQEAELMIAAKNSWVLAYDNLSGMPAWLSDGLCIVSTGGTYTARTLYTNDEETSLRAQRPVIVNGIDDMTTRPDFADRAIMVSLPVTHGPRGNIVDMYTTFPWAALCDEVTKLKIALREGLVLDGDFRGLAARFAATQRNARNRWAKTATPAGHYSI